MSLILDLALVGIVALCAWRGFRSGIINGIMWIVAIAICLYGANLVATAYEDDLSEVVEPFAVSVVESAMTGGDSADGDSDAVIDPGLSVDEREKLDVFAVSLAVLRKLGIADPAARALAQDTADKYNKVDTQMTQHLTGLLCGRLSYVLLFAVGFVVLICIFTVAANILDLHFGIPGHENLNHITGAALGVIRGILIIFIIGCFCRYLGIFLKPALEEKTLIYKTVVESNKLAELLHL